MSGNVDEWTGSEYTESYDGSEEKCSVRDLPSLRGGSWISTPGDVRAANRHWFLHLQPDGNVIGFRLARGN